MFNSSKTKAQYDIALNEIYKTESSPDLSLMQSVLSDESFDVNQVKDEQTLLDYSVSYGSYDICKLLLDTGKVSQETMDEAMLQCVKSWFANLRKNGADAEAITEKYYAIAKLLLEAGAYCDHKDILPNYVFIAFEHTPYSLVKKMLTLLLEYGADVNSLAYHGYNLLNLTGFTRSMADKHEIIELLLKWNINPELAKDILLETPLIAAVINKDKQACEVLLNHGADPSMIDMDVGSALYHATLTQSDFYQFFYKKIHTLYPWLDVSRFLEKAVASEKILYLGKRKFEEISKDETNAELILSPAKQLTIAVMNNNIAQVRELVKSGVDINIPDGDGFSAMTSVAANKYGIEMAKTLLELGADINSKDENGQALLYKCITCFKDEKLGESEREEKRDLHYELNPEASLIQFLLSRGVDVNVKTNEGWTPLHKAALWGNKNQVKLFLSSGANSNEQDNYGMTALHRAAQKEQYEIIEILLEHGASSTVRSNFGRIPLDYAYFEDTRELLTDATSKYETGVRNAAAKKSEVKASAAILPSAGAGSSSLLAIPLASHMMADAGAGIDSSRIMTRSNAKDDSNGPTHEK